MARRRFTSVSVSRVPDSDSDEGPAPTTERMRLDSTVRVGRRTVHSSRYLDVETSPQKRRRQHTPQPDYLVPDVAAEPDFSYASADGQPPDEEDFFAFDEGHPVDKGPRESRESDRPLNVWARYDQEQYLDELLRCEGRGDYVNQSRCAECGLAGTQEHRCRDCFTDALFCSACMVKLHADNPFHTIETWKSTHFSRNTLRAIGARLQLGHLRGERCPGMLKRTPEEVAADSKKTFCIVDHNGIHEVFIDFCVCGHAQSPMVQLLRARLYPATPLRPASAATFRVLRQFHKHSFESKCSPFEFYNALARETNNTGNFQPRNRYREFVCISREWRRLQLLKRFGRGHIVDGVRNIKAGACALLCPACPQPGKNLPFGGEWRSAPHEEKFLYAGFYAVDANFRMERKQVSSEEVDPGLNEGAAFFGEVGEYMEHVKAHWDDEQQKSTCVSHDAVNQPDRESRGTASSGIGTVDCARHNMKRPNGVGDLQKGERYINMDYMLWKSLEGYDELMLIVLSYDIVCQWSINLWPRLLSYNTEFHRRAGTGYRRWMFLVPKFHLPAHIEECNIRYSFNLTPYVGQTDGEAPERGWANVNPLATSTKEMGPGARRDTLDDHFNDWNHKKIIALGQLMLGRIQKAVAEMVEKQEELVEMEASLPEEIVKEWTKAMQLWEADATKPNPFDVREKHASLEAVRGRIANETRGARAGDAADDVRGELHASEMIEMGLRLESQQRDLGSDNAVLTAHASDGQKTTLLERRNKLARKITSWIKIQSEFQPEVARLREADDRARAEAAKSQPTTGIAVESVQLWLPSKQAKTPGSAPKPSHARYEFDMREARAHEALEEVRCLLLVRTHHYKFKDKNVFGVAKSTRSRTTIEVLDERIRREANEYRAARSAMASLAPHLNETRWALVLRDLKPEDIRAMPRALFSDPEKRKGKKRARRDKEAAEPKEMSWIWRTGMTSLGASAATSEEAAARATNESLRVEWAKARARAHRWREEVDLLEEEMRRILVFLDWKAGWWRELNGRGDVRDPGLKEGLVAYAERQAGIQEAMKQRFQSDWQDVARWIAMGREGAAASRERASAAMEGGSDEGEEEEDEDSADESLQPVPSASRNVAAVSAGFVANSLLPDA
ncbi:CxC2 domain-containing protein [Favolaschia claudopus]|uniref:CxC2 domain-containing protein n=1 Tax=Favolaschia claudopus TaxID=2862362 RepID=A0AAW0D7G4_9AGAR